MQSLQKLVGGYGNLFDTEGAGTASEGEEHEEVEDTFASHWGWLSTIDDLSKGDRVKWEFYLKLNLVEFLNELAFRKDKREQTGRELMSLIKNKTADEANILLLSYLIQKS